ncbi:MAG: transcriptional regulator [Sphingopyxis sp.]|nr:transcriptional regulator [Sphingopyxis sp.]
MNPGRYQFDDFTVDPVDRSLRRSGAAVELGNRYFDALTLLLRERGRLVTKDRFMAEVWHGVPVTDEALTQCIRTLRRLLGDDAGNPRFIETIPKHGYRFIGVVEAIAADGRLTQAQVAGDQWRRGLPVGAAAMIGGGMAGVLGGLFYGLGVGPGPAMGGTSALFVLLAINMIVGLVAGAGVGAGLAAAEFAPDGRWQWTVLAAAAGGLVTGSVARLIGLDAFTLLFGQSPRDMTGASEGLLLGAAVGLAAWVARRHMLPLAKSAVLGGLIAGAAGVAISLSGGTFLGGSLDFLLRRFPESRFRLDAIGAFFGESGFGPVSSAATSGIECLLFGACVVGAISFAAPTKTAAGYRKAP